MTGITCHEASARAPSLSLSLPLALSTYPSSSRFLSSLATLSFHPPPSFTAAAAAAAAACLWKRSYCCIQGIRSLRCKKAKAAAVRERAQISIIEYIPISSPSPTPSPPLCLSFSVGGRKGTMTKAPFRQNFRVHTRDRHVELIAAPTIRRGVYCVRPSSLSNLIARNVYGFAICLFHFPFRRDIERRGSSRGRASLSRAYPYLLGRRRYEYARLAFRYDRLTLSF